MYCIRVFFSQGFFAMGCSGNGFSRVSLSCLMILVSIFPHHLVMTSGWTNGYTHTAVPGRLNDHDAYDMTTVQLNESNDC